MTVADTAYEFSNEKNCILATTTNRLDYRWKFLRLDEISILYTLANTLHNP